MAHDPRVEQLVDQLLAANSTPEVICAACPELLPAVRTRWQKMRRLRADLDVLFPPPDETIAQPAEEKPLPRVPGYEIEGVLGRGGQGIVFRARHLRLNRSVALKMILAGAYAGARAHVYFQREVETVAGLRHPNVVHVYDVGDADGQPYYTMELVDGGSLARKLAGAPQPARPAAQLLVTLAGAVDAAHACGIIHRDLKPANILLTADGTPKISDFGLARRTDGGAGVTQTGVPVGTPSYMAPEQAQGRREAVGTSVDIYALGAILYELLTGRPPFRAETAAATMQLVLAEEAVPPKRLNPRVPRDLETICLKCLQKEPGKRYATAADVAADLERFLKHEPIRARPPGRLERCLRWVRRRPTAAALVATVTLLVVAGAVGAWLLYQQESAALTHQAQTNQEVCRAVEQGRSLMQEGWRTADLAKLREARTEGNRAVDIARSGGASAAVLEEAEGFLEAAAQRLERAKNDRALLGAVLDVSDPQETSAYTRDRAGRILVLAQPSVDEQYATAFRNWGLDMDRTAENEVVERLRREPAVVVQELIGGVDAWMMERRRQKRPEAEWRRLFRVADRLDSSEQHRRLRALLVGDAPPRAEAVAGLVAVGSPWPALWELARGNEWLQLRRVRKQIDPRKEPMLTVVLLAQACDALGDAAEAEEVLRQAAAARPDQVVLLMALGKLLERDRLEEAIGYYRAARGQRRSLGIGLNNALVRAGRATQGEEILRELALHQPDNPALHFFLGVNLWGQHKYGQAEEAYRKAIALQPNFAKAHTNLAAALNAQRKHGEAEAASHRSIALQPGVAEAHINLGGALHGQAKPAAAEVAFRKAIALKPDLAEAHHNLGRLFLGQKKFDAAEAALRKAIALQPDFADAYYFLGNVLAQRTQFQEAAAMLQKASDLFPEGAPGREPAWQLREQCQRFLVLEARLPAILKGKDKPANPAEQIEMARLCNLKKLYASATRLYANAFARRPQLAEGRRPGYRYNAACSAALAGCGRGDDAAQSDDAERARWRAQARQWLRADLAAWAKELKGGLTVDRVQIQKTLSRWQADAELAGLRDPDALAKLPSAEGQECQALWDDVDALLKRARPSQ
jgi:serine/threonine-protein kinase